MKGYAYSLIIIICTLFIPTPSHADEIVLPVFNLNIVVNSQGQDNNFHFNLLQDAGPFWEPIAEYDLQTVNLSAEQINPVFFWWTGTDFLLIQDVPDGWDAPEVSCTSDDPANTFDYQYAEAGVKIHAQTDQSNITCVFDNAPIDESERNPILIVPGILGTEIFNEADELWADIPRMINPFNSDSFMDPMQFNANLKPSDQEVYFGQVIKKKSTTVGNQEVTLFNYTAGLIEEFENQGYVENDDLFLFPYDWRYGITGINSDGLTNVDLLEQKIYEILLQTGASQIDVIAHSNGGLLVKKYVMDNPATHNIDRAVYLGVPNTGAPKALKILTQGDNLNVYGLSDEEMKKISKNMPVIYDLSPSEQYFAVKGPYYKVIFENFLGIDQTVQFLNVEETNDRLVELFGGNPQAIANAGVLHTPAFDNFDLRTAGIDLYNIVGCKASVISRVVEKRIDPLFGADYSDFAAPETSLGDGTVPLESATNLPVDEDHKYFALESDHGKMPSQNGIKQLMVNLLAGSSLPVDEDLISQDFADCNTEEQAIYIYSPLDIEITDTSDPLRRLGKAADGSLQNDIPNAGFYVFGNHKFVFLPNDDGHQYDIALQGSDEGTFTLQTQEIIYTGGSPSFGDMATFANIPANTNLTGELVLDYENPELHLDTNGDETIDEILAPSAILTPDEALDLSPPITSAQLSGTRGQPGHFRSDVEITLTATDPEIPGEEDQTSGILQTYYQLDGGEWEFFSPPPGLPPQGGGMGTLAVGAEGQHVLNFYSVDRAGNVEPTQILEFTIDKTAPEAVITFDLDARDIVFSGTDNLSPTSTLQIMDADDQITIADEAGNTTLLKLKEKQRKSRQRAEIRELFYNNIPADTSRIVFRANWNFNKQGLLKTLEQHARSLRDFNIDAIYKYSSTKIAGRDETGKIMLELPGFVALQIHTAAGDMDWQY